MPKPIALCLEDMDAATDDRRYLRCVALDGRHPGLCVDPRGEVSWQDPRAEVAVELWVSGDEKLILYRPEAAAGAVLHRGGRSLAVPAGKPVVLLDDDWVEVGKRRIRLHVHGEAPSIHAPDPFIPEQPSQPELESSAANRLVRAAATALALGTAAMGVDGCKRVEVRDKPPKVEEPASKPDAKAAPKKPPVEIRDKPPKVAPPDEPEPADEKPEAK